MPRSTLSCGCALACLLLLACGARNELRIDPRANAGGAGSGAGGGATCAEDGAPCAGAADCCSGVCSGSTCGDPPCAGDEGPVVLASGLTWPIAITQDGGNVYVSAYVEEGGVYRIPKSGGEPIPVAAPLDFPDGLVIDGSTLFVAESGGGRILRVGTNGEGLEALATGQGGPTAITRDDSRLFWTSYVGHHIASMPAAGGAVTVLADPEGSPYRLAVGTTTVAWSGIGPGLWSVPKQGGPMTQIAGGSPRTIVAEGARYYYNDTDDDTVRRVEEDGSDPTMLASLSALGSFTEGLAIDAEHLYVTLASGSVVRAPREGGEAEILASERIQPAAIAVDGACVYWTEVGDTSPGSGSVVRARK